MDNNFDNDAKFGPQLSVYDPHDSSESDLSALLTDRTKTNAEKIKDLERIDSFVRAHMNTQRSTGCSRVEMLEALVISLVDNKRVLEKMLMDRAMKEPITVITTKGS